MQVFLSIFFSTDTWRCSGTAGSIATTHTRIHGNSLSLGYCQYNVPVHVLPVSSYKPSWFSAFLTPPKDMPVGALIKINDTYV